MAYMIDVIERFLSGLCCWMCDAHKVEDDVEWSLLIIALLRLCIV